MSAFQIYTNQLFITETVNFLIIQILSVARESKNVLVEKVIIFSNGKSIFFNTMGPQFSSSGPVSHSEGISRLAGKKILRNIFFQE